MTANIEPISTEELRSIAKDRSNVIMAEDRDTIAKAADAIDQLRQDV